MFLNLIVRRNNLISAELEHRDYVGSHIIARQFSTLRFYANSNVVGILNELSDLIDYRQKTINKIRINCLEGSQSKNNIDYKRKLSKGDLPNAHGIFDDAVWNI